MFTGIIKGIGTINDYDDSTHVLRIHSPLFVEKHPLLGASIAIDGVCLTVSHIDQIDKQLIGFDLGLETRSLALFTKKRPQNLVNIEYSLSLGDPMDGHLVQGHVNGIAELVSIGLTHEGRTLRFKYPLELAPLIAKKGSIAINGVSLTINDIIDDHFTVCLVPYTWEHTSFKEIAPFDLVHLETDILGRYLHRFYENFCHKAQSHTLGLCS